MRHMLTLLPFARAAFPGITFGSLRLRVQMLIIGARLTDQMTSFLSAPAGSSLTRLIQLRPQMLGALLWPYQNADWPPCKRLERIAAHCLEIDNLGAPFAFSVDERLVLLEMDANLPKMSLVLDQPEWFMREGGLTLNIFIGDFRAYSVAFSLFRDADGMRSAYIGAVQGRNTKDALDLYRTLTKALYGLRPRDFLIEVLRILLNRMDVEKLYAVSDCARHHRHRYFKNSSLTTQNYDEIWTDRGGAAINADTFLLPISSQRRELDEVKAKKRSLYRQRYAFLDKVAEDLAVRQPVLSSVQFDNS